MLSETKWIDKAERYCLQAERCVSEVRRKLESWNCDTSLIPSLLQHLVQERFVDEDRYSHAFARDKLRYNHWGRVKIRYALLEKQISETQIRTSLADLDYDEYMEVLLRLLQAKRSVVKGCNAYECRQKLIRFALGHGFEMKEVLQVLSVLDDYEEHQ